MAVKTEATLAEPVLKHDVFRRLLLSIFAGEWSAGDRLPEVELAERFGVSRTPVREALLELAAIGFIELRPNCGAVMRPCGPRQVREIYQVREILEAEATRLACGRLDIHQLEELVKRFEQLLAETPRNAAWSKREWVIDRCHHELIARGCGNVRLAEEIERYGKLIQVIRESVGNVREAQVEAVEEHIEILRALIADQPSEAARLMRRHIRNAAAVAIEALTPRLIAESSHELAPSALLRSI